MSGSETNEQAADVTALSSERRGGLWRGTPARWKAGIIAAGCLAVLAGIYYLSGYILTSRVKALYADSKCEGVVSTAETTRRFYPAALAPFAVAATERGEECAVFLEAERHYAAEAWHDAYEDYSTYLNSYSGGVLAVHVRQDAAASLLTWAGEQQDSGEHKDAAASLNLLLNRFGTSAQAVEAKELLPEIYSEWADDLRAEGKYDEAAEVLDQYVNWADRRNDAGGLYDARLQLARLYFDWAVDRGNAGGYEQAVKLYEFAVEVDPDPVLNGSPTRRAGLALPNAREAWGDQLLEAGSYAEAARQFELSVNDLEAEPGTVTGEALVRRDVKWALALSGQHDFRAALRKLDEAQALPGAADSQTTIEDGRADVYAAFSESKGSQAVALMGTVVTSLCEDKTMPDVPPVLGTNANRVRVALTGPTADLPADMRASTPGELRYVACVTVDEQLVETCGYASSYWWSPTRTYARIQRWQTYWIVSLWDATTGRLFKTRQIGGPAALKCPQSYSLAPDQTLKFTGGPPAFADLEEWLRQYVK